MRKILNIGLCSTVAATLAATVGMAQQPFELDPSFQCPIDPIGPGSQFVSSILPVADRLLVSGLFRFGGDISPKRLGRLNGDGGMDGSFPFSGLAEGKLTAWTGEKFYAGTAQTVRRILPTGQQDVSFIEMNGGLYFSSFQGGDYHLFPDGRVLMSGSHQLNDPTRGFVGFYNLIWFTNTGYLDTTRIHRKGNGNMFEFEALHPASPQGQAGQFICSIQGTEYEGTLVAPVFRINADGSLDPTFNAPIQPAGWSWAFEPMEDGKVLVGGARKLNGQEDTLCLLRLLQDGSLDPDFHIAEFKNTFEETHYPQVLDILRLPDGRMVITGNFDLVDGHPRGSIVMLNSDGTVDTSVFENAGCDSYFFTVGTSQYADRYISGITPAPNGSYYIYGSYHGYDDGTTSYPEQRFVSRLYGLDVGIQEPDTQPLRVYPNPSNGSFTVDLDPSFTGVVQLLDLGGRVVYEERVRTGHTSVSIAPEELAAGAYALRVASSTNVVRTAHVVVTP